MAKRVDVFRSTGPKVTKTGNGFLRLGDTARPANLWEPKTPSPPANNRNFGTCTNTLKREVDAASK